MPHVVVLVLPLLSLVACHGDGAPDPADTGIPRGETLDSSLEILDTGPSWFEARSLVYVIQFGIDAGGGLTAFQTDGVPRPPAVFLWFRDRAGRRCTYGRTLTDLDDLDAGQDGVSTPDPDLRAWLTAHDAVAGFATHADHVDTVAPDCTLDPRAFGDDPVARLLGVDDGALSYVGVSPTVGPWARALLDAVPDPVPPVALWVGGALRVPFTVTDASDRDHPVPTHILPLYGYVQATDAAGEVLDATWVAPDDLTQPGRAAQGAYTLASVQVDDLDALAASRLMAHGSRITAHAYSAVSPSTR